MVSTTRYKFVAHPGWEMELARSTMLKPALEDVADEIVEKAKALAPVAEGDYRDGFVRESGVLSGGVVGAQVQNHDWKASIIEYGTVDHEFDAPLRRAIESAGYAQKES